MKIVDIDIVRRIVVRFLCFAVKRRNPAPVWVPDILMRAIR